MRTLSRWQFLMVAGLLISILLMGCGETANRSTAAAKEVKLQGKTMGTNYHITYLDSLNRNLQQSIDSILVAINLEVSTYIDTAIISLFNNSEKALNFDAEHRPIHFINNLNTAKKIWQESSAAFDPTVMPLVQYWGFGTEKRAVTMVDSVFIDSLKLLTGFDKIRWREDGGFKIEKTNPGVELDFSALAKGYGVDQVGALLSSNGIHNYMVEIGGEVLAKGKNAKGNWWSVGINTPSKEAKITEYEVVVELKDKALATSGNYRNFYEINGKKYGHTINPSTGFPEHSNLLSASVFANDCTTADALATAFMVMGLEKAYALAAERPDVDAYFIYGVDKGDMAAKYTEGVVLKMVSNE